MFLLVENFNLTASKGALRSTFREFLDTFCFYSKFGGKEKKEKNTASILLAMNCSDSIYINGKLNGFFDC